MWAVRGAGIDICPGVQHGYGDPLAGNQRAACGPHPVGGGGAVMEVVRRVYQVWAADCVWPHGPDVGPAPKPRDVRGPHLDRATVDEPPLVTDLPAEPAQALGEAGLITPHRGLEASHDGLQPCAAHPLPDRRAELAQVKGPRAELDDKILRCLGALRRPES